MTNNPKTLESALTKYHAVKGEQDGVIKQLHQTKEATHADIADLEKRLSEHQSNTRLDMSDEAMQKELELKQKIASAKMKLESLDQKSSRLSFGPDTREAGRKALELAKEEKKATYEEQLPGVLEAIEEAKRNYLEAVVAYHDLNKNLRKGVIDVAHEVGQPIDNFDIPRTHAMSWFNTDSRNSQGIKYGISEVDVLRAANEGKLSKFE